ncbi:MAG: class I SAM-dependent methyltransferase [Actinomycetota bacterium]
MIGPCPACGGAGGRVFHQQDGIPSHSCLLLDDRRAAERFPTGALRLTFCDQCGFIWNGAYNPSLAAYSTDYEETQGFSPRFRGFAHDLASRLVDQYDIHDKDILEIGCGKAEFLALLCEIGVNRGIGIDPSVIPDRVNSPARDRMRFIQDYYRPDHGDLPADVVVCRHTLEHIADVGQLMAVVRSSIPPDRDPLVVFELPDVGRVLRETAFWDIYYEHCSYFSPGSLTRLFRSSGFDVVDLTMEFDDQYIVVVGRPAAGRDRRFDAEETVGELAGDVAAFERSFAKQLDHWSGEVASARARGDRVVIWGGGSKGVSFLTTLGLGDEIAGVVDINPHKQGKFMAGTGHEVVGPERLRDLRPGLVIAMNPVYLHEIGASLRELGVDARLTGV